MKIGLVGYGKTGQMVKKAIDERSDMECTGIVSSKFLKDLSCISEKTDVIIDFSHPSNLDMIKEYAKRNHVALVLGTTGYQSEHIQKIKELAEAVPVVYTANFSLGITIFQQVLKQITPALRDTFDIELIEMHHKMKLDAPSGTAKMLLAAMEEGEEIAIHSVRGGTIAGEHTVLFAGDDEILEITHRAGSNKIFASGAILAAQFAARQAPGLYDMNEVLFKKR